MSQKKHFSLKIDGLIEEFIDALRPHTIDIAEDMRLLKEIIEDLDVAVKKERLLLSDLNVTPDQWLETTPMTYLVAIKKKGFLEPEKLALCEQMIQHGYNLQEASVKPHKSPLFAAIKEEYLSVVGLLIAQDKTPLTEEWGEFMMVQATKQNAPSIIELLHQHGFPIDSGMTSNGAVSDVNLERTHPLLEGLLWDQYASVSKLLELGANVHFKPPINPPLHIMASRQPTEETQKIIEALLNAGADPYECNTQGENAFQIAERLYPKTSHFIKEYSLAIEEQKELTKIATVSHLQTASVDKKASSVRL